MPTFNTCFVVHLDLGEDVRRPPGTGFCNARAGFAFTFPKPSVFPDTFTLVALLLYGCGERDCTGVRSQVSHLPSVVDDHKAEMDNRPTTQISSR